MPSYLLQVSYRAAAVAAFIKRPHNRVEVVRKPIEKLGGSIGGFWMAFGDYDVIAIVDMPDNVSAAALALAISAGGACKNVKTTPLLSAEEGGSRGDEEGGVVRDTRPLRPRSRYFARTNAPFQLEILNRLLVSGPGVEEADTI